VRIGVIGTGNMGVPLARMLTAHGHHVVATTSRGPDAVPAELVTAGVEAGTLDAALEAEVVVLALPWRAIETALAGRELAGRVVVDVSNPYSETFEVIDTAGRPSSAVVADWLPGARVVKAFNTMHHERLETAGAPTAPLDQRAAVPVAGDDVMAKDLVADLIAEIGFAAVDVGTLADSTELTEPGQPLYNVPLTRAEMLGRLEQLGASR
jgi:8-hydroxy-5-deazaflavin:NADPH oxidoreductase